MERDQAQEWSEGTECGKKLGAALATDSQSGILPSYQIQVNAYFLYVVTYKCLKCKKTEKIARIVSKAKCLIPAAATTHYHSEHVDSW